MKIYNKIIKKIKPTARLRCVASKRVFYPEYSGFRLRRYFLVRLHPRRAPGACGVAIKYAAILLLVIIFAFSDFISFLSPVLQKDNFLKIFEAKKAYAVANGDGLMIYGLSGNAAPQIRLYDNAANSFGVAAGAVAGAQPVIVRTKSSPAKEEFIAAYQDNLGNLQVMCYDGVVWSNEWSAAVAPAGTPTTRRFDISYESSSGDVIIAYSRNVVATNALAYRTKSGLTSCGAANWAAAANFPAAPIITTGIVQWVKADRDERSSSDLSAWIWAGSNRDLGAAIWSGATFTNLNLLETNLEIIFAAQDVDSFELAYESLSGDLMVVWGSGGNNGTNGAWYNVCVGGTFACAWSAKTAISSLRDDATVLDLSADPVSDQMAFSSIGNAGSDLQAAYWNGSAWTGYANLDTSCEAPAAGRRLTQTGWVTNEANTKWILTYDDANGGGLSWYAASPGMAPVKQTDWAAAPAINDIRGRYEVDNNPFDASELMLTLSDSTNAIFAKRLNMNAAGTLAWTNADEGASLGVKFSHPQQGFSFAYRRYIFIGPDAISFSNDTDGALADGGRTGQQITVTGIGFGAGPSDGGVNAVKIGTYIVPNENIIAWSANAIIFTIPASATVYGGAGANGLIVRAGGIDDITPLAFYVYPNITSVSANSGQIGSMIAISGDHFGAVPGIIIINAKIAVAGLWTETSLSNVKILGQEGAANIIGKIQLARASDARASNQYPADPFDFTILAPSVSGSNPSLAAKDQTLTIEFFGQGIDTDTGTEPILKLTKGQAADCAPSATCIIGASYAKISDYQAASASFDLTGAATGYWKLVIINMDSQSGFFGDELTAGFYISAPAPAVTGINPGFGNDSGIANIALITGANFQDGATAKLTRAAQADIVPSAIFSFTDSTALSSGAFDLTGKTTGFWNVAVTNPDFQVGTYSNGFEIRSAKPSDPINLYQFKTNADTAEPPATGVAIGEGIGTQSNIYFRMDMRGGVNGDYYPQVEIKALGDNFDETFIEGTGVNFTGMPVQGWVNITSLADGQYHWQARVRNSAGTSAWVSFGGNPETERDIYIDATAPTITLGTDNTCFTATPQASIADLSALVQWNTDDTMSGAALPPGSGAYAQGQVDYKKGFDAWVSTPLSAWENSLHQTMLLNLVPATVYTFRVRARDYVGNETVSLECVFTTTASRPIKTVEFFILQESAQNTGAPISKNFSVYLPESPSEAISVKSAFIEISGISSDGAQMINVELRRGLDAIFISTGTAYNIDSSGTTTPFAILFDALSPALADGNQDMKNITEGAIDYPYTLFLNGNGVTVSAFSAKLIITYSYAQ